MKIRIKKNGNFVTYTTQDLNSMDKKELKLLKQEIQGNIESVSWKRSNYNATNSEDLNSKEYYKQMSKYKKTFVILKSYMCFVNEILKNKENDEFEEREHWLWCFYDEASKKLKKKHFDELVKNADERVKYHIDFKVKG